MGGGCRCRGSTAPIVLTVPGIVFLLLTLPGTPVCTSIGFDLDIDPALLGADMLRRDPECGHRSG